MTVNPQIVIENVRKTYGHSETISGISLTVRPGEVVAIIGPSGGGKSTLLRTINHLAPPTSGVVTLGGELIGYRRVGKTLRPLAEKELLEQRTKIGFVFQHFNLLSHLTAEENVAAPAYWANKLSKADALDRARKLLTDAGLGDRLTVYPRQLSGGQQQRVAIARALILDPPVILLDEPTSALDPELVDSVLAAIRDLAAAGRTLIVVTHEIAFARDIADQVVVLADGRLIEKGSPARVIDHPATDRTRDFLRRVRGGTPIEGPL